MDPLAETSTRVLDLAPDPLEPTTASILTSIRRVLADARANPLPVRSTWRGVLLAGAAGALLGILLTLGAVQ